MDAPDFKELLRDWPAIQRDISFLRALRNLRVITDIGQDIPLRHAPESINAVLDLRGLTPTGAPPPPPPGTPPPSTPPPTIDSGARMFTACRRTFAQTIGHGVITEVQFDTPLTNNYNIWSAGTPARFTVPSGQGGVWLFVGDLSFAHNVTGARQVRIIQNGTTTFGSDIRGATTSVGDFSGASCSGMQNLADGDYVTLTAYQNSGLPLNLLSARLTAIRLGDLEAVVPSGLQAETETWMALVAANVGMMASDSIAIADALMVELKAGTYFSKIKYMLPFLGSNLAAARCPIIDTIAGGLAANSNFIEADFTQATGIKGNGTNKILNLTFRPNAIGTTSNGGIGFWENNIDFSGTAVEPVGTYGNAGNSRFALDLRNNLRSFRWGGPGNSAGDATAATNGHYYGQRSSATSRQLWKDAVSLGTNATNDAATGSGDNTIRLVGCNEAPGPVVFWKGRCACAYFTDGTLTSGEVTALHAALQTYLITATGR